MATLETELTGFFEEYGQAFGSRDVSRIARFFFSPTLAVRPGAGVQLLPTKEATEAFFRNAIANIGAVTYHLSDFHAVPLGAGDALATMRWTQRQTSDGSVVKGWRQSYNLHRTEDTWKILVSKFHVDQPVKP